MTIPVAVTRPSKLTLPQTGFTLALLAGVGLLLTAAGFATRRVARTAERSA